MRQFLRNTALGAAALALLAGGMAPAGTATADDKVKVYVSLGFEGNTWMDAATNLLSSIAGTKDYKDRVDIEIQSARGQCADPDPADQRDGAGGRAGHRRLGDLADGAQPRHP